MSIPSSGRQPSRASQPSSADQPRSADQQSDQALLRRAVELAAAGPLADANPRVGAVITNFGRIVGEGFHRGAGNPHAEVEALSAAGELASGGTAHVSLEPCAHQGRTAPCARALIDAGVTRVVFGAADPNPSARGGAEALREAGVEVLGPIQDTGAEELNRYWDFGVRHGRPFVTWKVAATLDGRVAAPDGTSQWITGPCARADVHRRRATAGAIAVGTGTVLADDPSLTVRDETDHPLPKQPLRVVLGRTELPEGLRVRGAQFWQLATHDPAEVLRSLQDKEIRHLWLEGGPTVSAAFVSAGLVDEVLIYLAPKLLGDGLSLLGSLGTTTLEQAHHLELLDSEQLGDDIRLRLRPSSKPERTTCHTPTSTTDTGVH